MVTSTMIPKHAGKYRTNLARLMNQLIKDGKTDKAKKIIELALTKMPLDKFDYYSLVDPFWIL
jgi:ribosomal protein S7